MKEQNLTAGDNIFSIFEENDCENHEKYTHIAHIINNLRHTDILQEKKKN